MLEASGGEEQLVQYLLGELNDAERDRIEEAFFADDDLHEQLLAIETELIDNYVRGELSAGQCGSFERIFLSSPERRERVEFARAIMELPLAAEPQAATADNAPPHWAKPSPPPVEVPVKPPAPRPGAWWQSVLEFYLGWRPAMKMASAAALLALVAAPIWSIWWQSRRNLAPESLLAQAYTASRPFEYRLPDAGYGPIHQARGDICAFGRPPTLITAEAEIQRRLAADPDDVKAIVLQGRAELLEREYELAIKSLARAFELKPSAPDVMAELGCAYAVRADIEKRNIDYGRAVDLFLKALGKQPANERILFNLALTYEKLSLIDEAVDTWRRLLNLKPAAGWAEETRQHIDSLEKVRQQRKKAENGVIRDVEKFLAASRSDADFNPEPYQDLVWREWLPNQPSNDRMREASNLVAKSFKRHFGDRSLVDVIAAGVAPEQQEALRGLADLIAFNQAGETDRAIVVAKDYPARLERVGHHAAAMRARLELAYSYQRGAMRHECLSLTEQVIREASHSSYVWILGQAHLLHAACAEAFTGAGEARSELENARLLLEHAGFWLAALRALGFVTGMDSVTGDYGPIWEQAPDGLRSWWTGSASPYYAQEFKYDLYKAAAAIGWNDCAVMFSRSAIASLSHVHNPGMEAADRVELAALLSKTGDEPSRIREFEAASNLIRTMPAGPAREDLDWNTRLDRAEADVTSGRAYSVIGELDRLSALAGTRRSSEQMRFEQARGMAFFAVKDWARARDAFQRAIQLNQSRAMSIPSYRDRIAELQIASSSYRDLVQMELIQQRDTEKALRTWRLYLGDNEPESRRPHLTSPTITFAILPAGIAVWAAANSVVHARIIDVHSGAEESAARRFLQLCASPSSDQQEVRRVGHSLFRSLIAPELGWVQSARFNLQRDSWIASIPFGALTDDAGNYLAGNFAFSEVARLRAVQPEDPITIGTTALIVSAPQAKAPGGGSLQTLNGAVQETEDVAAHFRESVVLRDGAADDRTIFSFLSKSRLFHFAGHGWSDGGNGALILAPAADGEPRFITSRELAEQDWSRCELAVLSACLTAAGEERGPVNNQSLVRALLSAGAHRVVAARWSVDSGATRALMQQFYAELFKGKHPAEGLAGAEATIAAFKPWSHPYYWAGFEIFENP